MSSRLEQNAASANDWAAQARALFHADSDLAAAYNHELPNGKWDHMMDQSHIGYTSWRDPPMNVMPAVTEIAVPIAAAMGVAVESSNSAWPGAAGEPALPPFDSFNRPRHDIDIFNRGRTPFEFSASADAPWIVLSRAHGTIEQEDRLWVSVDWGKAPQGSATGSVKIAGAGPEPVKVRVASFNPRGVTKGPLPGFVETPGYVSIEAEHFTKKE